MQSQQMSKYALRFLLLSTEDLGAGNYLLRLRLPEEAGLFPEMYPGQFVQVAVPGGMVLLRRPISICNAIPADRELWLLIGRVGKGTSILTTLANGTELDLLLPLGNTFTCANTVRPLLVGGGVGIAPMYYLASAFVKLGIRPTILLGGRTAQHLVLRQALEALGEVYVTTDNGEAGLQGRVTDHPILREGAFDRVYTCGPKVMMLAVAKIAEERGIDCEVSLENMMACGIGACLCCVEDLIDKGNTCVCTEGPVFNSKLIKKG